MALPTISAVVGGNPVDIGYAHTIEYYTKGIDERGPYYEVAYRIDDYAQSDGFANALLGIGRTAPHRYPLSPNLTCAGCKVEGVGRPVLNDSGTPGYDGGAIVHAHYRAPVFSSFGQGLYGAQDDPGWQNQLDTSTPILWCTQEIDFEIETTTYPRGKLSFASDSKTIDSPVQVDVMIQIMSLTFHRLPYIPATLLRTYMNTVNSAAFLGCDANTVLCVGAKTSRDWNADGTCTQRAQVMFKYRTEDWRKVLRDDQFAWDFVVDSNSNYRYSQTDFNTLLQALAPPLL